MAKKKRKRRRRRHLSVIQKLLVSLTVALGLTLGGVLIMQGTIARPDLSGRRNSQDPNAAGVNYGEGIRPKVDGIRKSEDFYTVLILGRDTGGGGNTDTMLLASYDVTNQKAAVMSIPRDTMVNVSWDVKKINSVYNVNGGGEKGIQALYQEISQLVGFEPDFRVVVEWDAVGRLVDAIGGVWFDVPYPMDYHDPTQKLVIEQAGGYRLLTGEDAMQVIRWRANDDDSPYGHRKKDGGIGDSGRMKVQQDFLKAVLKQLMQPANVLNIASIAEVFQDCVETDLSLQEIFWFAGKAVSGGLSPDSVDFCTMPYQDAYLHSRTESERLGRSVNLSYVTPIADELLDIVNNKLSPFQEVFGLSDLDIMSVNRDGTVSSTTGRVEDPYVASDSSRTSASDSESGQDSDPDSEPGYDIDWELMP